MYISQYYSVDLKADNGDESKKEEEYQDRQSGDKVLSPVRLGWNAGENCSDYSLMTDRRIRSEMAVHIMIFLTSE